MDKLSVSLQDPLSPAVRRLEDLVLEPAYKTGRSDPTSDFYLPCLSKAVQYDRAVGYFRSSIYLLVGSATVGFAKRGGRIRLVCSTDLRTEDVQSIEAGYEARGAVEEALQRDLDAMLEHPEGEYRTRVLATLIASGAMDVRIAVRTSGSGIYHEKVGLFGDDSGQWVSFVGSANETLSAWREDGNFESIEVFCTWKNPADRLRSDRHRADFEDLWLGKVGGLYVHPFPDAIRNRLLSVAFPSLDSINPDVNEIAPTITPLEYQQKALEDWETNGKRGILVFATGAGKTLTAILAIQLHVSRGLPVLVVVPSALLLAQWKLEIEKYMPHAVLLIAGAGNARWKRDQRLRAMTSPAPQTRLRIVLATLQTATKPQFMGAVCDGDHLMVVADEVHQTGSPVFSSLFNLAAGPRLGLSATPDRYGDLVGTDRLRQYFGNVLQPIISLQDAIQAGRLVEYLYHPTFVPLDEEETALWVDLTNRIRFELAASKNNANDDGARERLKQLLIRRSRIAKKASGKIPLAKEILRTFYSLEDRWLVYCEDMAQLRQLSQELSQIGMTPLAYHTQLRNQNAGTLDWFRTHGGVLLAIRCLDEGIDIPAVTHALILASSQNPRQFIQRRGRVLRSSPGKRVAVIYDAIVVPGQSTDQVKQFSLLRKEMQRAFEFATSALNGSSTAELRAVLIQHGLDPEPPAGQEFDHV